VTSVQHYEEAERLLGLAKEAQENGAWAAAQLCVQRAQVHATLVDKVVMV
jgi:hypothetical protein